MIISGIRSPKIGELEITDTICETCGKQSTNKITVFGRYVHVFWIPTFPVGRIVVSECDDCQFTLKKKEILSSIKEKIRATKKTNKKAYLALVGYNSYYTIYRMGFIYCK